MIPISEIERIIADLEFRKSIVDKEIKATENSRERISVLENMFSSGAEEALKYVLVQLKELLPK